MTAEPITLYTAKICPWAHRTELALKESGLDYKRFEIDLTNKPEWYAPRVNPASKVPALAYGGPADADPANPSPESTKIAESYVLIQFIAELSSKPLLPSTPVERAKARFFIETFTAKFPPTWYGIVSRGEDPTGILAAVDVLQGLLPPTGYAVGEQWTIADAAVTPFLSRTYVLLKNDIGAYEAGAGKKVFDILTTDDKYARFRQYYLDVTSRASFKETFYEDHIVDIYSKRFTHKLASN